MDFTGDAPRRSIRHLLRILVSLETHHLSRCLNKKPERRYTIGANRGNDLRGVPEMKTG
jgi:hypothetical protein